MKINMIQRIRMFLIFLLTCGTLFIMLTHREKPLFVVLDLFIFISFGLLLYVLFGDDL